MRPFTKILSYGILVLCSLSSFHLQAINVADPVQLQCSKHHRTSVRSSSIKFSIVNVSGDKIAPSFRVPIKSGHGVIALPLSNFTLPEDGYLIAKPKSVDVKINHSYLLSCNDAYMTPFSIESIPTFLPIKGFSLSVSKNGKWVVSSTTSTSSSAAIPAGDHTINAQSIYVGKNDISHHSSKHVFQQTLLDSNYFLLSGFEFAANGTQFNVDAEVRQKDALVSIKVASFTFEIGPNDPYDPPTFNPGGYVTTLGNALPEHLRPGKTQTLVIDQGTLGLNVSIDTYGRLTVAAGNYFAQTLPIGIYTVPETTFQYFKLDQNLYSDKWVKNFIIQQEFTDLSQNGLVLRDSHVNDFHEDNLFPHGTAILICPHPI